MTYIPSVTAKEKFTCRALIRSHTFSWENTRTGRGGSCPDSGMKILSCDRARLPSALLDSLGHKRHHESLHSSPSCARCAGWTGGPGPSGTATVSSQLYLFLNGFSLRFIPTLSNTTANDEAHCRGRNFPDGSEGCVNSFY